MKKLINICGTARCGSTMIDLILGNDPKAFSLGEINAWFRPYRTHHFKIKCSCKGNDCPWEKLKHIKEDKFYPSVFQTMDVDFIVDSSKDVTWVIDNNIAANKHGIKVYNILLFKEPISFFYSFWKRGYDIDRVRKNVYIKYYERCFESGLPFICINYNKFVAHPQSILKEICRLVDIPFFEGKEKFWEKEYHQVFGSRGARKQVEKGSSNIKEHEAFHEDFMELIPKIENDNRENIKFQKVVKKLYELEMEKGIGYSPFGKITKPYWYYLLKQKQKFQKIFPQKWKYDQ